MTKRFYTTHSAGRWVTLHWRKDTVLTPAERKAIGLVARVPGCTLNRERYELSIACTAWMLSPVHDLQEIVGMPLVAALPAPAEREIQEPPSRSPYTHQREAIRLALGTGALLLADTMGLGKTTTALVAAKNAAPFGPTLIVAPRFTRAVWRRELIELGYLQDSDRDTQAPRWVALTGRKMDDRLRTYVPEWIFCHYEVVAAWWSRLALIKPKAVIVDEVHWAKNRRTQRGKGAALALGPTPFRMLLTGTPMENRPSELWNLLSMTTGARTWGSFTDFRIRYCGAFHNGHGYEDTEPTHTRELRQRIRFWYLQRGIEDTGVELPALVRKRVECPVTAPALAKHEKVLADIPHAQLLQAVFGGQCGVSTLKALAQLRKIVSSVKVPTTVEYVQNARAQDLSVVVFTWQKSTARTLAKRLHAERCVVVTGEDSQDVRDAAVETFQAEGGVLCATIDSLKEGVTLTRARVVVLHDLTWSPTTILQAERRIHRIGQRRGCVAAWMVAEDTIDELFARVLREKLAAIEAVFDRPLSDADEALEGFGQSTDLQDRVRAAIAEWREW